MYVSTTAMPIGMQVRFATWKGEYPAIPATAMMAPVMGEAARP